MKTKTEKLDALFYEWEQNISGYKGKFIKDGIIDEELYVNASTKILFIMKEPNNPDQKPGDFREWWKEEIAYTFSYRIAEWSFGLLNNFPHYDKIWRTKGAAHKAIKHVSVMNIKKIGGGGNANFPEINSHFLNSKEFLLKQIEIINPQIIILGLSFWSELRNNLFPGTQWKGSGYNIEIGKFNDSKIIDFYHPSSRTPPSASYSLLQNIVSSDKFKDL